MIYIRRKMIGDNENHRLELHILQRQNISVQLLFESEKTKRLRENRVTISVFQTIDIV